MKAKLNVFVMIIACLVLVLSACGKGDSGSGETKSKTGKSDAKGGTLNVGLAAVPEGNFQSVFAGSTSDSDVISYFNDSLVEFDKELNIKPKILSWEQKKGDDLTYKFKVKKGIKWHDGNDFTINDWLFTLETIADPDYDGPRYNGVEIIEGADAKHKGEANSISGIKKIDDYTAEIKFKEHKANNLLELWTGVTLLDI